MVWVDCGDDDDDRTAGVCQKHTAHVYDFGLWQKKDGEMQLQFLNDENIKKSSCLSDFTNFGYSNVFKSKKRRRLERKTRRFLDALYIRTCM